MKNRWFRNKKNGKPYKVIDAAINATNGRENENLVVYTDGVYLYVRKEEEFNEKFVAEPIYDDCPGSDVKKHCDCYVHVNDVCCFCDKAYKEIPDGRNMD